MLTILGTYDQQALVNIVHIDEFLIFVGIGSLIEDN